MKRATGTNTIDATNSNTDEVTSLFHVILLDYSEGCSDCEHSPWSMWMIHSPKLHHSYLRATKHQTLTTGPNSILGHESGHSNVRTLG
jgi:hypothetical protein